MAYAMSEPPFVAFGPSHLLTVATILAVSLGLPTALRLWGSERLIQRVGIGLAVFIVVHEVFKTWVLVGLYDEPLNRHLPLQICGMAVLMAAVVLVWRPFRLYEVIYFWGLAGAVQALLTPEIPWDFPNLVFLGFFISHGMILVGLFYATIAFRMRPTWSSIPRVFAITLAYAFVIVAPLNVLLDTNFMYLRGLPSTGSVLDLFGPWPWYIAGAALFTLASFVVYYLPFAIRDLVVARRAS
ncbi:MAG: TIGR02206 family membrane protein [Acidobacteriota bacterium]